MSITFLTNEDEKMFAKSINGVKPDPVTGDIIFNIPDSGGNADQSGLTAEQISALDGMFKVCAFNKADVSAEYNAFQTAFGIGGEVEPEEPDVPEKTLTSISAVYSGGSVTAGTAVNDLTGIVVTAHYSDGTSATVTGYTLSGTITEGSNTITVSYGGKTTMFTVTGTAESGGEVVNDTSPVIEHVGYNLSKEDGSLVELANSSVTKYYEFEPLTAVREFTYLTGSGFIAIAVDSSGNYLEWFSGRATEKTSEMPVNSAKIRFAINDPTISKSYAYWQDTGEVIFAGKNSPYYNMANIDGTPIGGGENSEEPETGVSNETTWTDGVTYTFDWVENEYVDHDDGSFPAYEGWKRSPMLYCEGASRIDFVGANSQQSRYNAFYDADKQFVSCFFPYTNGYIDIPEGAVYFAVSGPSGVTSIFTATPRA